MTFFGSDKITITCINFFRSVPDSVQQAAAGDRASQGPGPSQSRPAFRRVRLPILHAEAVLKSLHAEAVLKSSHAEAVLNCFCALFVYYKML